MTSEALRKRAAKRSREEGYRDQKRGIHAVSESGCDHIPGADGHCLVCRTRLAWTTAAAHR